MKCADSAEIARSACAKVSRFGGWPGDALLVDGIDQRQRVGLTRQYPSKQSLERRRCVGLDHGRHFADWFASGSVAATRFPEDIPSTLSPVAVLSDSSARSIAL